MSIEIRRLLFGLFIVLFTFKSALGITLADDHLINSTIDFTSVPKTDTSPKLDGQVDETCWQKAVELPSFVLTAGKPGQSPSQKTKCYLLYDDTHLYVAFQCFESKIGSIKSESMLWDDADIFYDDFVVVYLDVNHDYRSFYELAVNPRGVQFVNMDRAFKQVRIDNNPISDQTYRIGKDKNNQIVLFVEQEIEHLQSVVIEFK